MEFIEVPKMSEILLEEFMIPLGISAYHWQRRFMCLYQEFRIFYMTEGK